MTEFFFTLNMKQVILSIIVTILMCGILKSSLHEGDLATAFVITACSIILTLLWTIAFVVALMS